MQDDESEITNIKKNVLNEIKDLCDSFSLITRNFEFKKNKFESKLLNKIFKTCQKEAENFKKYAKDQKEILNKSDSLDKCVDKNDFGYSKENDLFIANKRELERKEENCTNLCFVNYASLNEKHKCVKVCISNLIESYIELIDNFDKKLDEFNKIYL